MTKEQIKAYADAFVADLREKAKAQGICDNEESVKNISIFAKTCFLSGCSCVVCELAKEYSESAIHMEELLRAVK